MILCEMETRSFSFRTIGRTERECLAALKKAWKVHARNSGADPKYLNENLDSVCYLSMELGQVFRDGGLVKMS
jgi:hypothetical protein